MRPLKFNNSILLTIITILLIINIIIYLILYSIDFSDFSILLNNILTPIITAAALIIYYLSLIQLKNQTKTLIEEKELLLSENIYKDTIISIQNIKEKENSTDLSENIPDEIERHSFSVLNFYSGSLIELIDCLKKDPDYQICTNDSVINESKLDINLLSLSNKYYTPIIMIFQELSEFLKRIHLVIIKVEENRTINNIHKELLMDYIAKHLLTNYFIFVYSKNIFNFKMAPLIIENIQIPSKDAFEIYKIERIFNFFQEKYPNIIDECIQLHRYS